VLLYPGTRRPSCGRASRCVRLPSVHPVAGELTAASALCSQACSCGDGAAALGRSLGRSLGHALSPVLCAPRSAPLRRSVPFAVTGCSRLCRYLPGKSPELMSDAAKQVPNNGPAAPHAPRHSCRRARVSSFLNPPPKHQSAGLPLSHRASLPRSPLSRSA
jgi:hypothetical protein